MMIAADLSELITRLERPCPELEACLRRDPALGWTIKHPLVVDVMVDPERCARQNAMLAAKRERVEAAREAGDWAAYLGLHERPFRFEALNGLARTGGLSKPDFGQALAYAWRNSENIHENLNGWRRLWNSRRLVKDALMSPEELAAYAALPLVVLAWRGYTHPKGCLGLSWTSSLEVAMWFAQRWKNAQDAAFVAAAYVPAPAVAAMFLRGEYELVIPELPRDARISLKRV